MMAGYRNILWLLPLILVLSWPVWGGPFSGFLAPRGGMESAPATPQQTTASDAGFTMEGVLFSQLKNGARDWQIRAARLKTLENQDEMHLETVEAQVFKGVERRYVITGAEGEYHSKKKILTMQNGVRVQAEKGMLVQADSLTYDDQKHMISTRVPVRITDTGIDIRGKGMDYDMANDSYDILGRVQVDIE